MTGLVVALFAGVVVVGLLVLAARDAFWQASVHGWTKDDEMAVRRLLQSSTH